MATQFDPIAKDESLNTTEVTPRNIADVLAEELSAIEQAIAGGSGSGGHTIVNASGTDMTQRAKMQFVDAGVTDDSANDKTKVEIVQTISAESDLTSAPDGLYQGTWDESVSDVLTADMVGYGSGTVEGALDGLTKIKTYSFTATLAANGACVIPTPPADLHFVIGANYSGSGYCYWSVGTQNNANKALMFTNSDGTKMTGTYDFTIAYI